jgi:peptidoglycan/xylan/chitin deacetylase (PgdA/CDA1 family)
MYHYVEYVKDQNDINRKKLSVSPVLFESHLKQLRQARYDTYFVRDIPDILNGTIDYSTQSAVLTFDDGYDDFYTNVFPLLKKYHVRATVYVITNFVGRKGFLTEKQIRELIDSGIVEVGSHTLDHLYLKKTSLVVAKRQIEESKKYFLQTYGLSVRTFAYPYGAFNEDTIQQVKDAGYTAAVSVISSEQQSTDTLFILGRVRPELFPGNNIISFVEKYNK